MLLVCCRLILILSVKISYYSFVACSSQYHGESVAAVWSVLARIRIILQHMSASYATRCGSIPSDVSSPYGKASHRDFGVCANHSLSDPRIFFFWIRNSAFKLDGVSSRHGLPWHADDAGEQLPIPSFLLISSALDSGYFDDATFGSNYGFMGFITKSQPYSQSPTIVSFILSFRLGLQEPAAFAEFQHWMIEIPPFQPSVWCHPI